MMVRLYCPVWDEGVVVVDDLLNFEALYNEVSFES